jgi:hypothetical protein
LPRRVHLTSELSSRVNQEQKMFTLESTDTECPVCPHCKVELEKLLYREVKGDLGKRCVFFCPECKACLGVSHRKGLTMGI